MCYILQKERECPVSRVLAKLCKGWELLRAEVAKAKEHHKAAFDDRHQPIKLQPGDAVLCFDPNKKVGVSEKLRKKWEREPGIIVRQLRPGAFEVQWGAIKEEIDGERLKKYHPRAEMAERPGPKEEDPPPRDKAAYNLRPRSLLPPCKAPVARPNARERAASKENILCPVWQPCKGEAQVEITASSRSGRKSGT